MEEKGKYSNIKDGKDLQKFLIFNTYDKPDSFLKEEIERLKKRYLEKPDFNKISAFIINITEQNLVHHKFYPLTTFYEKVLPIQNTPQKVQDFSRLMQSGEPEEFTSLEKYWREKDRRKIFLFEKADLHEKIPTNCHGKALWATSVLKVLNIPARIRQGFYFLKSFNQYVIHERPEFFYEEKWNQIEVDNLGPNRGEFLNMKDLEKIRKKKKTIIFESYGNFDEMIEQNKKRDEDFLENKPKPVWYRY